MRRIAAVIAALGRLALAAHAEDLRPKPKPAPEPAAVPLASPGVEAEAADMGAARPLGAAPGPRRSDDS